MRLSAVTRVDSNDLIQSIFPSFSLLYLSSLFLIVPFTHSTHSFRPFVLLTHYILPQHTHSSHSFHPLIPTHSTHSFHSLIPPTHSSHSSHPLIPPTHSHSFQGIWWATQACSLVLDQTLPYGRASRRLAVSLRDHACSAVHAGLLLDRSHLHISW